MAARQRIIPVRREYNRWVANQTLEDYALRFTAKSARRFSSARISQTAIGAISFLALEAIGGAITMSYGTTNAIVAILVASLMILIVGLPISRYAIRHGVDIDLLTRGASFGYIGSTITSLIYASFTFILFAIEASIMSGALELALGIPLWIGYIVSAVMVIPLVTHGVKLISRFQLVTQPFWIVLNVLPFAFIAFADWEKVGLWLAYAGIHHTSGPPGTLAPFHLVEFGAASAVIFALMAQIGEQVDFLRFLPPDGERKLRHRIAVFLAGSGWVIVGAPKLLAGSFLVVLALSTGVPSTRAADPAQMYYTAFGYIFPSDTAALLLMAAFVVVSQLKINVMNAYAGSLAWSNFFSRLTHSHPGRVIWLVFNVAIALLLMELGIYRLLEETLGIFSIVAMAWLSTISADLFVNKPLGLAPPGIEFKRAHLYDINPVGLGTMGVSTLFALVAHFGAAGEIAASLAPYIALVTAFVVSPLIAWWTEGKFYLARKPRKSWLAESEITCSICEHPFEPEDMAWCPAYAAPICSLCCSLDSRCHDMCKPKARLNTQVATVAKAVLPETVVAKLATRLGRYAISAVISITGIGVILAMIAHQTTAASPETAEVVERTIAIVFFVFAILAGVVSWFYVLAHDSRVVAEEESSRQNTALLKEIAAHKKTDAALQDAKERAESANRAKSRYVVGLSHELRTPLNAVLGYAQILERDETIPPPRQGAIKAIRRSADHLSGLIDGLLDISKIEAGKLQVYSNEINIQDFLDQIVDMFRPQAQAKGIAFEHNRAASLPQYVRTDDKRLRQILVNLLSNALKFTERGHIRFDVAYRSQVASFTIEDSGRGISEKDLPKNLRALPARRGGISHAGPRSRPDHHAPAHPDARRRNLRHQREGQGHGLQGPADALCGRPARRAEGPGAQYQVLSRATPDDHRGRRQCGSPRPDARAAGAARFHRSCGGERGGLPGARRTYGTGPVPDRHLHARHERLGSGDAAEGSRPERAGDHAFGQYRRRLGRRRHRPRRCACQALRPAPAHRQARDPPETPMDLRRRPEGNVRHRQDHCGSEPRSSSFERIDRARRNRLREGHRSKIDGDRPEPRQPSLRRGGARLCRGIRPRGL